MNKINIKTNNLIKIKIYNYNKRNKIIIIYMNNSNNN